MRVIEVLRPSNIKDLHEVVEDKSIDFEINSNKYHAEIGNTPFSKQKLDNGTRFLLDTIIDKYNLDKLTVADFGTGWGAIPIVLNNEFKIGRMICFEKDYSALDAARLNLKTQENTEIIETNLFDTNDVNLRGFEKSFDFIISNPPFHCTNSERDAFFKNAKQCLKDDGYLIIIVEKLFNSRFLKTLNTFFTSVEERSEGIWTVIVSSKA